jgi:hypothetical protein
MFKIATAFFAVLLVVSGNNYAQLKISQTHKMIHADKNYKEKMYSDFYSDYQARKTSLIPKNITGAQTLMYADLDWVYWNYMPDKLVMADITGDGIKDPVAIGEKLSPVRYEMIAYIDAEGAKSYALYGADSLGTAVKTGYNGELLLDKENNALYPYVYDALTGDVFNHLWVIDLGIDITSPTKITANGFSGSWPRASYLGNKTFLALADNKAGHFDIMKSVDGGVTFKYLTTLGSGDSKFWFDTTVTSPLPADPLIETNGTKISIICGLAKTADYIDMHNDISSSIVGVADEDSANCMYHYYSTDAGITWHGEVIGIDGKSGQVVNREEWPRFSSWDIGNYKVDKTGVTHLVHIGVNSIGVSPDNKAIWVFPLFYWNDKDKNWMSISGEETENYYPIPDDESFTWPANFLGNSSPVVAVSDDGQVVVAAWVMPEFSGEWGNSGINYYSGDNSNDGVAVYYTDIAFAYSKDGGKTWSKPEVLENSKNTSEGYPCLSPEIEIKGSEATINYMYYLDAIPGAGAKFLSSPQNSLSNESRWIFNSKTISLNAVGVNDKPVQVNNYSLEQNYPNPFNPGTEIKFTLAKTGNVSLKVYDMLGREAACLVNSELEAGSHTINFNAANLASGVYIYTLNAGNFSMTKKMMFLK